MTSIHTRPLNNKNILVTGGSRGLGRAIALEAVKQGANLAFTYSQDEQAAKKTLTLLSATRKQHTRIECFKTSATDLNAIEKMLAQLSKQWDELDILINNAGMSKAMPLALMHEQDWDQIIDTNLKSCYLMSRAILPQMIRRRQGNILNIGSLAGTRMIDAPVHYCASKAAIKGFTESLCKEVGRYNIRVNCLAPGLLEQGVADNLPAKKLSEYLKNTALGRVGTLAEIAKLACFMVSDRASYMTGNTLLADGGF